MKPCWHCGETDPAKVGSCDCISCNGNQCTVCKLRVAAAKGK